MHKKEGKSLLRLQHSSCKGNMDVDLGTKMLKQPAVKQAVVNLLDFIYSVPKLD